MNIDMKSVYDAVQVRSFENPVPPIMDWLRLIEIEDPHAQTVKRNFIDRLVIAEDLFEVQRYQEVDEVLERYREQEFPAIEKVFKSVVMFPREYTITDPVELKSFVDACEGCSRIVNRFIQKSEEPETRMKTVSKYISKLRYFRQSHKFNLKYLIAKFWRNIPLDKLKKK